MQSHSRAQQRVSVELPTEAAGSTMPKMQTNDAEVARSKENILRWMSYLPDDCVRTMIEMGWDITT
jgi:hypothetical protein